MTAPELSVIVTIVDGGVALRRCLDALAKQRDAPPLEVLLPFDDTVTGIEAIDRMYEFVRPVPMGRIHTERPSSGFAGQHELFDRRRAAGLHAARGALVAMIEDRSVPRREWARRSVEAMRKGWVAVGGAIENGVDRPLNWAVYLCDFGRYRRPFAAGPTDRLSDVNVTYARAELEAVSSRWKHRYHEPEVNAALQDRGGRLYRSPDIVVDQLRDGLRFLPLLGERYHWARLYAARRTGRIAAWKRWMLAALSPFLPVVLGARVCVMQIEKRRDTRAFLSAMPAIACLLVAWSAGELVGYVTGRP